MLFVVDFDGTISTRDTIDQLLEKFADPSWEDLEKDWCKKEKMYYEELSKRLLKAKPKITIKLELEGSNE